MLVGLTKQIFFRCMTCGADLEQHVNGVISYIPHIHKETPKSKVDEYFTWPRKLKVYKMNTKSSRNIPVKAKVHKTSIGRNPSCVK